eukprot:7426605-Pyramimonas_sp.AAC.1
MRLGEGGTVPKEGPFRAARLSPPSLVAGCGEPTVHNAPVELRPRRNVYYAPEEASPASRGLSHSTIEEVGGPG